MRKLLATAAVAALTLGMAQAASAAIWTTGDVNLAQAVDFNGIGGDPVQVIPGLTSTITFEFTGASGDTWNFNYTVENTSSAPITASRVSSFGFDVAPNLYDPPGGGVNTDDSISSTGLFAFNMGPSSNIPNGIGTVDACFYTSGGNCTGAGGSGVLIGGSTSGTFSLLLGSATSSLELSNFYVRYQSITGAGGITSATGVPTGPPGPIPEPATWAMMITGFFGAGAMLRRRRRMAAAAG